MGKIKVYLDICCYNRPFDDQMQIKIHLETEAILYIQDNIRKNEYKMVWSYMIDFENNNNPYEDKKRNITMWKGKASEYCSSSEDILLIGQDIMKHSIQAKDSLHLACAIKSNCDYFITTDSKLMKKKLSSIRIINSIDFVRKIGGYNEI